ncbi:MAG: hypothetical protein HKN50_02405 [Gammaproteobacteria bacterium]|nr:hypothetical protein [Gammaproteobacteria bacterium]
MKQIIASVTLLMLIGSPAHAIQKCQDSEGKWHYGDAAVEDCENSKITTLNNRGMVVETEAAPKSEEELAAERAAEQAAAEQAALAEAELEERRRILSIYETEKDIQRQLDNQINSVQSNIEVQKAHQRNLSTHISNYKTQLASTNSEASKQKLTQDIADAEEKIAVSNNELKELEAQKRAIQDKFFKERELYLRYKKSASSGGSPSRD